MMHSRGSDLDVLRLEEGFDERAAHAEQQIEVVVRQQPRKRGKTRGFVAARYALPIIPPISAIAYRAHDATHQGLAVLHVPREIRGRRGAHEHQFQRFHDFREDEFLGGLQRVLREIRLSESENVETTSLREAAARRANSVNSTRRVCLVRTSNTVCKWLLASSESKY